MYYDYALINIDTLEGFEKFYNDNTIKNYLVTSFDLYSIRKGLESLSKMREPIKLTKVLFLT